MWLSERMTYDGSLLHSRFAYRFFQADVSPYGNLLVFRGPMEVLADYMIDQEDLLKEDFIWSDDALNFVWELPLINTAFASVTYQWLFNREIAQILSQPELLNQPVTVAGDDLMVTTPTGPGKCSVSIATLQGGVALGHTGVNLHAGSKAPKQAWSTQLSEAAIPVFVAAVQSAFARMNRQLFAATAKTLSPH